MLEIIIGDKVIVSEKVTIPDEIKYLTDLCGYVIGTEGTGPWITVKFLTPDHIVENDFLLAELSLIMRKII
jgi:hypothetical protein